MTIEQIKMMLEQIEELNVKHYEEQHLLLLKWQKYIAKEEQARDMWAEREQHRLPKKTIEDILKEIK